MYPINIQSKGEKANFRRSTKNFAIVNNELKFNRRQKDGSIKQLKVIWSKDEVLAIIRDTHEGIGSSIESRSLQSHHGRVATVRLVCNRFYWRTIEADIKAYIESCDKCQRVNSKFIKEAPNLHPVAIPSEVMSQIGVDICSLPPSNGYKYIVVAIDYFSKWSEAKPLENKNAISIALFLYELICRFGCFSIQINDQGREFVNSLSDKLHQLTGTKQRITSAYHPQANGLVERQNRTIKEKLLKILDDDHQDDWPKALNGVLFAHRTAIHNSTGLSPYRILYGRDPVLPIDVKFMTDYVIPNDHEFNTDYVRHVVDVMTTIRETVNASATKLIQKAQSNQCKGYNKRHHSEYKFKPGNKVLLRNLKRDDRKGGKYTSPWLGPYTVKAMYDNNTCLLEGDKGKLKCKQHICNLKLYKERTFMNKQSVEQMNDQSEHSCRVWIKNLRLTEADKASIVNKQMLDDKVIDAAQTLLRLSHYPVDGLDSTLLVQAGGFEATSNQCVQIHFDVDRQHWITSSTTNNRVEVADSLFNGELSSSIKTQLKQRYATMARNNILTVFVLPTQQQVNGVDCGCHAIATAVEFLVEDGEPLSEFDREEMRAHLVLCLEKGDMQPFPKSAKISKGKKQNPTKIYIII